MVNGSISITILKLMLQRTAKVHVKQLGKDYEISNLTLRELFFAETNFFRCGNFRFGIFCGNLILQISEFSENFGRCVNYT